MSDIGTKARPNNAVPSRAVCRVEFLKANEININLSKKKVLKAAQKCAGKHIKNVLWHSNTYMSVNNLSGWGCS
jgi:hypothetical protein